ncbi:hypothetical protein J3Q64DRAFT_1245917 [Phycomyces blakesleeanus]|uniref:Secreted protein n=2 Tax=Phycomyces blakesleeanus TaxID=4837 RepID=A0A167KDU2_PHYB8|nr:hypothetical protein PHYBLDRAFT_79084 [Phycomyces blakesleeanus NRRL 1555(-)]OAD67859.1 hypothetical protein PHYBLDRAFT_79084 [Phycomyces blakesleeanus NRRL 1555(-)]|eukprot:XP_018285899.1 hypothetical protein PHYBLDRAFT_79084 [Phycomyces blakesleeanus NRRL 1555(-)]
MQFSALVSFVSAIFALAIFTAVEAAPASTKVSAACLGFRITSPVASGLKWTYGQCYSVDWDLGASQVKTIKSVDLYSSSTKKKIATEKSNVAGTAGTSGNFPLLMGDDLESGNYYFQVNAVTASGATCTLSTVAFNVNVNPNSPPVTHC